VIIDNVHQEAASALLQENAVDWLTKQFALWIERYPLLSIIFHGTRIDPAARLPGSTVALRSHPR